MKTFYATLFLTSFIVFAASCNKEDGTISIVPTDNEVDASVQLSLTDAQLTDGVLAAMDAADGLEDGGADLRPVGCVTVTSNEENKTVTVDFGAGCVSPVNGANRSGKIIITYVGDSYIDATERSFEFVDYTTVDTVVMNGTFIQSNISRSASAVSFNLNTEDFTFTFNSGKTHTISAYSKSLNINLGENERDYTDDVTTITGNSSGVTQDGVSYSVSITTPVVFNGSCIAQKILYPSSGSYEVKIGNYPKFTISWGNGDCDKILTITYLTIEREITLK